MEFHETKLIDNCRCGKIRFINSAKQNVNTPGCMLYTRGGAAPYLTNEMLEMIDDGYAGVHITLPTL